jgi:hypothetical protein
MQAQFRSNLLMKIYYVQPFIALAKLLLGYLNFALKKVSQKGGQVVRVDGVR